MKIFSMLFFILWSTSLFAQSNNVVIISEVVDISLNSSSNELIKKIITVDESLTLINKGFKVIFENNLNHNENFNNILAALYTYTEQINLTENERKQIIKFIVENRR